MKISNRNWLIIFLVIILVIRLLTSIINKEQDFFWFCVVNLLLLIIALCYKNDLILSSVLVSSLFIEILRIVDIVWFFLTGRFLTSVAAYLSNESTFTIILNNYHLFLVIVPIFYLLKKSKFHDKAWIFSSLVFLASSIATLIFTNSNTNCVRFYCELGIFDFFYYLKYPVMPFILFHWVLATILIFIPSHYLIKYFIRKLKDRDDYNRRHRKHHKQP